MLNGVMWGTAALTLAHWRGSGLHPSYDCAPAQQSGSTLSERNRKHMPVCALQGKLCIRVCTYLQGVPYREPPPGLQGWEGCLCRASGTMVRLVQCALTFSDTPCPVQVASGWTGLPVLWPPVSRLM